MTPRFFLRLDEGYRQFLEYRGPPVVILICDPTPSEWRTLARAGPKLRGPARWITTQKRYGWDDVDIAHVIRAAYEFYKDERLNIGDSPHHGYEGGRWIGTDVGGKNYGKLDRALRTSFGA